MFIDNLWDLCESEKVLIGKDFHYYTGIEWAEHIYKGVSGLSVRLRTALIISSVVSMCSLYFIEALFQNI